MGSSQKTHRGLTVVGLILALAMGALEATVVSTAMPTVIGDLGGIRYYAWIANAYLLTSSVSVPIFGKLADVHGRKPIILLGIAVFLVGSAASGAAQSMTQLVLFRALQGVGAGSMQPMALTIVGDIFDLEERSRMQGIFGAAWGLFGLIGPMLGGLIVHHLSWRWVFYMNLPFGLLAAFLLTTQLHEGIQKRPHSLDLVGAFFLTTGVVALLIGTSRLGSTITTASLAAAALLLTVFVFAERRAVEPILPLALFARPVLFVSSVAGTIIGGAMIAFMTYVPLFVQGVMNGTPTEAGSAITPMVVGWPIASAISGRLIPRVGFRPLIRAGLGITALAGIMLGLYGEKTGLFGLRACAVAFGIGMGFANTALLIAVQTSVEWQRRGIVTASTMFFRTIGGALAVGCMGGVLNASLAADPSISPEATSEILKPHAGTTLDPAVLSHLSEALADGLGIVFWIIAAMASTAFVASLWFPYIPTGERGKGKVDDLPDPTTHVGG